MNSICKHWSDYVTLLQLDSLFLQWATYGKVMFCVYLYMQFVVLLTNIHYLDPYAWLVTYRLYLSLILTISLASTNVSSFNQPLEEWNVANVADMEGMFSNASSFNQPLNDWNVTNMSIKSMFWFAKSFNQSLEKWSVTIADNDNVCWCHHLIPLTYHLFVVLTNFNIKIS